MDEEKKEVLTMYDSEDKILKRISETDDAEELEKLANALEKIHGSIMDEAKDSILCELEERKFEQEKKRGFWSTMGTILAALIGAGGVIGAQYVKGEMDSRYQDEGYNHEKTEAVIWNRNRHRR